MRIREKTLRQILYSHKSSLSLNLKVSVFIRMLNNSKEKIEGLWRLRGHRSWPARFLQTNLFCLYPKWFLLNRGRQRIRDRGTTWIVSYWWYYTGRFATMSQRCVAPIVPCVITLKRWHRVAKTWTSKGQWGRPTSNEGHSTAATEVVPALRKFLHQNKNKWF